MNYSQKSQPQRRCNQLIRPTIFAIKTLFSVVGEWDPSPSYQYLSSDQQSVLQYRYRLAALIDPRKRRQKKVSAGPVPDP